jgi:hypothetical protein
MRSIICAFLLTAYIGTDIAEARRSREHPSYRFLREFYEEHRNKKTERRTAWGEDARPLPYWDCEAITERVFAGTRIVNFVCINGEEKE